MGCQWEPWDAMGCHGEPWDAMGMPWGCHRMCTPHARAGQIFDINTMAIGIAEAGAALSLTDKVASSFRDPHYKKVFSAVLMWSCGCFLSLSQRLLLAASRLNHTTGHGDFKTAARSLVQLLDEAAGQQDLTDTESRRANKAVARLMTAYHRFVGGGATDDNEVRAVVIAMPSTFLGPAVEAAVIIMREGGTGTLRFLTLVLDMVSKLPAGTPSEEIQALAAGAAMSAYSKLDTASDGVRLRLAAMPSTFLGPAVEAAVIIMREGGTGTLRFLTLVLDMVSKLPTGTPSEEIQALAAGAAMSAYSKLDAASDGVRLRLAAMPSTFLGPAVKAGAAIMREGGTGTLRVLTLVLDMVSKLPDDVDDASVVGIATAAAAMPATDEAVMRLLADRPRLALDSALLRVFARQPLERRLDVMCAVAAQRPLASAAAAALLRAQQNGQMGERQSRITGAVAVGRAETIQAAMDTLISADRVGATEMDLVLYLATMCIEFRPSIRNISTAAGATIVTAAPGSAGAALRYVYHNDQCWFREDVLGHVLFQ